MSKDLKNFNSKYNTEINQDTVELDLLKKKLGDEGLKLLCSIKFNKLEQILLEENDIKNVDVLSKNSFGNKIKALDLSTNKISSINVLATLNFPNLNHLFLNNNQITSINVFAKVNFPNLRELNLSSNKLNSIDVFTLVKFPQLSELDLSKNELSNIDALAKANFTSLTELNLEQNKISSLDVFAKINCDKLKKLKLAKNNIKSIDLLEKISFSKLNCLSIGDDTLGDNVEALKKIKFGELEDISLYLNESIDRDSKKIQDIIDHFEKKDITFNFISCDDDNDLNFEDEDLNDPKNNTDGFENLLNSDIF